MATFNVAGSGTGTSWADLEFFQPPQLRMSIPDDVIGRGPSAVTIILTEALPLTDVTFDIDGTVVMTETTDTDGGLIALSLPVDDALSSVGTHTVTASQVNAVSATATFTVQRPPYGSVRAVLNDADPVAVPGAVSHDTQHWVLQDLTPGGLGSYIMPVNPSSWTPPHVRRTLEATHTTAQTGIFHVTESGDDPVEFSFRGYCPTQEMQDTLLAYGALKRRFYLIDHRNRAWKVAFTGVDMVARRRQAGLDGLPTDWAHDYTVTALAYEQVWRVPQT